MEPHFFQLIDRIRYEAAVAAISKDGKSLAIISAVHALAEHYKDMLIERLNIDVPHVLIKPFFPADTDAIVSSFNQVVADLPLTQAMAAPTQDRPMQLWVVHDAAALPAGEVMMMLDLLEKFPGAHVRALLVFAGAESEPEGLASFNKSLMRWTIARPSLDQIKESLGRVSHDAQATEVRALIARMAPTASAAKSDPARQAAAVPPAPAGPADITKPGGKSSALKPATTSTMATRLKAAAVVAALLMFSAGVAAWLNPQAFRALVGQTNATLAEVQPQVAEAVVTQPTQNNASSETEVFKGTAAPGPETPVADINAAAPLANTSTAQVVETVPPQDAIKQTQVQTELPGAASDGQAWMKAFARGTFVVQHTNSETYAKARDRQKRFPNLSQAKVVPQFEAGQSQARYALVSGPFATKELADEFLQTQNMPKESWVRSSRAMQKRLFSSAADVTQP